MVKSIVKMPKYAIFLFKRFDPLRGHKISTAIDYPEDLMLEDQFMGGSEYSLFGVVLHYGSPSGGHYKSIVKRKNRWYMFNDSDHKKIKKKKVISDKAYILFYRRND
jgi:ubiquitin C-terminal hydrolase